MLLTKLNVYLHIKIGAPTSALVSEICEFNTMYVVVGSIEMREATDADLPQIQKL